MNTRPADQAKVPPPAPEDAETAFVGKGQGSALGFLQPAGRPDSLGRLGHYEILEVLGRGGFGIVFRAFDEVLQRVVAIKVLAPEIAATSPARKRFLREARSAAQVRHENVVQIHAVEELPLPFLVMEFVPGETLQQRLDRTGPLDAAEVVVIGRQVAEGLAAAHAAGLIHRDVKPGNILLENGPRLRVKITDFGLARAADDASLTQSGVVAGTPLYMSPEQARGDKLDHRTDLFSLGSVLYVITSGRPPFRAENTLAVLKRVAEDTARPIPEIIPEAPAWLCRVIAKLMAKDPKERFQTATEVAEALEAGRTAPETVALPVRRPLAKQAPCNWLWVAGALALLAVLGVVAFWLTRDPGAPAGPGPANQGRGGKEVVLPGQPIQLPTPEELAARPAVADGLERAKIPPRLLAQAGAGTAEQAPPAVVAILGGLPFQHERSIDGVGFSPDGKRLVTADGPLRIWDVFSGQELFSLKNLDTASHVCWSPDGKFLASGQGAEGKIWDLEKRQVLHSLPGHDRNIRALNFSPQSDRLVTSDGAGTVRIWSVETGKRLAAYSLNYAEILDVKFDHTGTRLVTAPLGNAPRVWDAATGEELVKCKMPHPSDHHPSVSIRNDGKRVVTTVVDGHNAWIWNAETGAGVRELVGNKARLFTAVYSPDGKLIATGGDLKDGIAVRLWNADTGAHVAALRGPTKVVYHLVFSPGGKWLASSGEDHRPFVWEVATGLEHTPGHEGPVTALALHPNGNLLASCAAATDTRIRLWDLATGRLAGMLPARPQPQSTLAFSPDGKVLASGSENDGTITFWDWAAGKEVDSLGGQGRTVSQLAFSPGGQSLAFRMSFGETKLYEIPAKKLRTIDAGGVEGDGCVAFSPDGKTLASGGADKVLRLWDVATGKELAALPGQEDVIRWAGFCPDGHSVAFGGGPKDGILQHWGLAPQQQKPALRGHPRGVASCAWRADGEVLASAGLKDGTVRLWDPNATPPQSRVIVLFPPQQGSVHGIAVTAEGRHLVTANSDGTIYVLRLAKVGDVLRVP